VMGMAGESITDGEIKEICMDIIKDQFARKWNQLMALAKDKPPRIGKPGAPGPSGDVGSPGKPGFPGQEGIRGLPGPAGDPGLQGAQGDRGLPGNAGLVGPPGKSKQGKVGKRGLKGPRGEPGIGLNGADGDRGEPGPRGQTGSRGDYGKQGPIAFCDPALCPKEGERRKPLLMNDNMKGPIPTGTASAEGPVDSAETFGQDAGTSGTVYNAARDPNAAAQAAANFNAFYAENGLDPPSNTNSKNAGFDLNGDDDDYDPIDEGDYDANNAPVAMMKDEYPGNFVQ